MKSVLAALLLLVQLQPVLGAVVCVAGASPSVIAVSASILIASCAGRDRVCPFPNGDAVHSVLRQPPTPPLLLAS